MIDKVKAWVELAIKAEAHAFILIIAGGVLRLKHIEDPGLIMAGLAIFKGKS
jgi:hypothetical protein